MNTQILPSRTLLLASGFTAVSSLLSAALFESGNWAATASASAGAYYSDNFYQRSSSEDGGYLQIDPTLHLFRRNSLTRLEFDASLRARAFVGIDESETFDPSLSMFYRYPAGDDVLSRQQIRALVAQRSDINGDLGELLRSTNYGVDWEGMVLPTGKLALTGRAEARRVDFEDSVYDLRDELSAGLTLAFVSTERLQLGVGYDITHNRAEWRLLDRETERLGNAVTVRGRGDLLPKVTGEFYAGAEHSEFSGSFDRSVWDAIVGASLTWDVDERRQLALTLDRSNYFAPNGDAVIRSLAGLEFIQQIAGGFRARVRVDYGRANFRADTLFREEDEIGVGAGLSYGLTDRLQASFDVAYLTQDSTLEQFDYDSVTLRARVTRNF